MDIIVDSIHLDCMNVIKKEGIKQEYLVRGFQNESFKDFSFSKSLILNGKQNPCLHHEISPTSSTH